MHKSIYKVALLGGISFFLFLTIGSFLGLYFAPRDLASFIKLEDHRLPLLDGNGYAWIAGDKILSVQFVNNLGRFLILNVSSGIWDDPPANFTSINIKKSDVWSVSADGKWVVINQEVKSNLCLISTDGNVIKTNVGRCELLVRPFWMLGDEGLFDVSSKSTLFRWDGTQQTKINAMFKPALPIGFMTNNLFLTSTNVLLNQSETYPRTITLEYWQLDGKLQLKRTKNITVFNEHIVDGITSPRGYKICWRCSREAKWPRAIIKSVFPYFTFEKYKVIDIYVSNVDGDDLSLIGCLVWGDDFPSLHWTNDGSQVSFILKDDLYLLPVGVKGS
jgi:hypothetical protein